MSGYALGTTSIERERLEIQAKGLDRFTEQFLIEANVGSGQRVLDIGCGAGDVSIMAAGLVGEEGHVLGVDIEPDMVAHSQDRALAGGLRNVSFAHAPLDPGEIGGRFDVVVARLVAAFQPDPAYFMRRAASLVRLGGTIGVIEPAWSLPSAWSSPVIPAYEGLMTRYIAALRAMKIDPDSGLSLVRHFAAAGLGRPSVTTRLFAGDRGAEGFRLVRLTLQVAFERARGVGFDSPDATDLEHTLSSIYDIAGNENTQFNGPLVIGAIATVA